MGAASDVLLAIEGGGSKGGAAVAWKGKTMARTLPGGLNPGDIAPTLLKNRLEDLILPLLDLPGHRISTLRAIVALAGAGRPEARREGRNVLRAVLEPRCSRLLLRVTSDAEALLERFFTGRDGVVLIAGTGSVCLGVRHTPGSRATARVGGWGSYLDRGSGFRLGLRVLEEALGFLDGMDQGTSMVHLICETYRIEPGRIPDRFLPVDRERVAGLARVALNAYGCGDRLAARWVGETIRDLVGMILTVSQRLDLSDGATVAVSGGLFESSRFAAAFKRRLKRSLPSARLLKVADPLACMLGVSAST